MRATLRRRTAGGDEGKIEISEVIGSCASTFKPDTHDRVALLLYNIIVIHYISKVNTERSYLPLENPLV